MTSGVFFLGHTVCDRNLPTSMEGSVESTRKATGTCPLAKKVRKMANAAAEAFSNTGGCSGLTPLYIGGRPTRPIVLFV